MRLFRWIAIPLFALLLPSTAAMAETPDATPSPYVLADSQQRLMTASGSGRQYQVSIAKPGGAAGENGYPVIYILDANAMFLTVVETVRAYARRLDEAALANALVVGIGYPPGTDISAARSFDLTPTGLPAPGRHPTGGAEALLDFIERDLKPAIARDFPVNPGEQSIAGHSLAGRFVLDTLTRRPDAFHTWIAMSSSFWYGNHAILPQIEAFASARTSSAKPVRLLITVGEFEERPRPDAWATDPAHAAETLERLRSRGQVTHARAVAERLSKAPAMLVDFVEFAGEDHGTVIPASIGRGVDFILAGPRAIPAVPTAQAYLHLGPEGRYRLRMQVRDLPDLHRIPWLNQLKSTLEQDLDKDTHLQLHEERQRMDREYGSQPHAVNADD